MRLRNLYALLNDFFLKYSSWSWTKDIFQQVYSSLSVDNFRTKKIFLNFKVDDWHISGHLEPSLELELKIKSAANFL